MGRLVDKNSIKSYEDIYSLIVFLFIIVPGTQNNHLYPNVINLIITVNLKKYFNFS
jgi:hypothetical protein